MSEVKEVTITRGDDGSLGVELAQDDEGHPTIAAIAPGGPCEGMLMVNDRVVAVEDTETATAHAVVDVLKRQSGATIRLTVHRFSATTAVEPKTFSTSALTVPAGRSLDVPLVVDEPSLGTFSFNCTDESFGIDFTILALPSGGSVADAKPIVRAEGTPEARREGRFKVVAPCTVIVRLDNSTTYVSPVTVACVVSLSPLSQLVGAEMSAMRAAQAAHQAHLEKLSSHYAGLQTQEAELEEALATLRVSIQATAHLHAADSAHAHDLDAAAAMLEQAPAVGAGAPTSVEAAMSAATNVDAAEVAVGHSKRVRAAALQSRKALAQRTAAAEESLGVMAERASRREADRARRESLAHEASRRAEHMGPLLPLQEVYAAFAALAAAVCGGLAALRSAPSVHAVYVTSREDLFVLGCNGFDLRDDSGARLLSIGTSYATAPPTTEAACNASSASARARPPHVLTARPPCGPHTGIAYSSKGASCPSSSTPRAPIHTGPPA